MRDRMLNSLMTSSSLLLLLALVNIVASTGAPPTPGITAYNCNTSKLEVATFDLNRVQECPLTTNITSSHSRIRVQIIQKKERDVLMVRRCKVITQMQMWHCGMHSHTSIANYDFSPSPLSLSRQECLDAHENNRLVIHNHIFDGIEKNSTVKTVITRAGSVWGEGTCKGGTFTLYDYTYTDVVVKQSYTISLFERLYYYKTGTEEITAFDGVTCKLSDQSCYDHEVGRIYWSIPQRECQKDHYESLYAGSADLVTTSQLGPNERYVRVISDTTGDKFQIFTPLLRYEPLCGLDGYATPYHGLYIIQYMDRPPFPLTKPLTPNVDLVRYIETKFMTFAFGSALTISDMLAQLKYTQCQTHRETLLNRLHIISSNPASANLLVGNKPGVYGRVAGEVIHVLQCPVVLVNLRSSDICTLEIPITFHNLSMYMDARTRIITPSYTVTECSTLTPIMFRHADHWVKMTPGYSHADTPQIISPTHVLDQLDFKAFTSYAMGGIYDPQDLQKLRDFIMFSTRREAMTSNIARSLEGRMAPKYDITKVLDHQGWERLAKDRIKQMWGSFQSIGLIINGLTGIVFIGYLVFKVVSIAVRCFHIYQLTGLSWELLASMWSCCTQFVILRKNRNPDISRHNGDPQGEMVEMVPVANAPEATTQTSSLYPTTLLKDTVHGGHNIGL